VPNALAWTFASLPMAVGFSLIGVVIAEFVGSSTGLGYIMVVSLSTLNATDMFVALTVLGAVASSSSSSSSAWSVASCTGRRSSRTACSNVIQSRGHGDGATARRPGDALR